MLSKEVYLIFSTKENADGLVKLASHDPIWEEYSNTSATILDKINGTSGPPLPPISMMPKWHIFAPSRLHHCFGGEGG